MNNGTYYKKENKSLEPILFFFKLNNPKKATGGFFNRRQEPY